MKKPLIRILVILFFLIPGFTKAQPFIDLLNVKAQISPARPNTGDASNKLAVNQYEGTFVLPLIQKNNDVILIGGDYTNLNFKTSGSTNVSGNLYSTSVMLGYEKQWKNTRWKTQLLTFPKFNSDAVSFKGNDFQLGGILLFKYKANDNLKFHFGGYYNREFFGNYMIPLVGIEWRINDRTNLFGDLPVNMTLEYKINKSLYAGAAYSSSLGSYRVNGAGGTMYVRDGDKTFGDNQVKLYVNVYLTKVLVLYAEGGQTFGRMFQLYNSAGDILTTSPVYQRSMDGFFADAGIAIRFRLQ